MKKGRDIKKDKSIKAKKAGKRVSADGNTYWESRKNRSDKDLRKRLADGGTLGVDLFQDYENIPEKVQAILDKHSEAFENGDYKGLEKALKELNAIGYTFEYGLDGGAYDLRKIGEKGKSEYMKKGGNVTTEKHPYKYAKGGTMGEENPRVYITSLFDYNSHSPFNYGKWFDLKDYADGETLMEAIHEFLNEIRDEHGGEKREEHGVHDYENFPSHYYHESMGEDSFNDVYEFIDLVERTGIPAEAIEGYVDYGHDISGVKDAYYGTFDNEEAFAQEYVDSLGGIENISKPEYYVYVTGTDRRIIAGEEANNARERAEEGGEELSDEDYDAVYDEWYEGLNDPYDFLVNEQGLYSGEDLLKSNFVRFDYEKFARDLLINNYFDVDAKDGGIYVFSRR